MNLINKSLLDVLSVCILSCIHFVSQVRMAMRCTHHWLIFTQNCILSLLTAMLFQIMIPNRKSQHTNLISNCSCCSGVLEVLVWEVPSSHHVMFLIYKSLVGKASYFRCTHVCIWIDLDSFIPIYATSPMVTTSKYFCYRLKVLDLPTVSNSKIYFWHQVAGGHHIFLIFSSFLHWCSAIFAS